MGLAFSLFERFDPTKGSPPKDWIGKTYIHAYVHRDRQAEGKASSAADDDDDDGGGFSVLSMIRSYPPFHMLLTCMLTIPTHTEETYRWFLSAVYGGLAGGVGRVLLHPLDTIKRRMQAQVCMYVCMYVCTYHGINGSNSCCTHLILFHLPSYLPIYLPTYLHAHTHICKGNGILSSRCVWTYATV